MITRRWFYPGLTRQEAEAMLMKRGHDGSFLVRPNSNNDKELIISVRNDNRVIHIRVRNNGEYLDLYGGEKFATLLELVHYYIDSKYLLRRTDNKIIRFKAPLNCPEPTRKHCYHGQLTAIEAWRILLENGMNGSFLIRDSQRQPGDFVLSVRTKDLVRNVIIRARNKYSINNQEFDNLDSLIEFYLNHPLTNAAGEVLHLVQPFNENRIRLKPLHNRVKELEDINEITSENKTCNAQRVDLPRNRLFSILNVKSVGSKPENINKNMYRNIIPLDRTRVVLDVSGTFAPPGSDYINASYIRHNTVLGSDAEFSDNSRGIEGEFNRNKNYYHVSSTNGVSKGKKMVSRKVKNEHLYTSKTYIATQGCLSTTIYSFWSMIWQEDIRIIVLATKETERGKIKCERYWPLHKQCEDFKKFVIRNDLELATPDYILRRFLVTRKDISEQRVIFQYHFKSWPERGTPLTYYVLNTLSDANDQLQMILRDRDSRVSKSHQATLCVQCSDGIGRTGVFIVIDMILDQIKKEGLGTDIDIHGVIQMVREQRSNMVQNRAQYDFIRKAVLEFIEKEKRRVSYSTNQMVGRLDEQPVHFLYSDSESDDDYDENERERYNHDLDDMDNASNDSYYVNENSVNFQFENETNQNTVENNLRNDMIVAFGIVQEATAKLFAYNDHQYLRVVLFRIITYYILYYIYSMFRFS